MSDDNLPINGCVDNSNVSLDFGAVFEGINVGGIDWQHPVQSSHIESIANC